MHCCFKALKDKNLHIGFRNLVDSCITWSMNERIKIIFNVEEACKMDYLNYNELNKSLEKLYPKGEGAPAHWIGLIRDKTLFGAVFKYMKGPAAYKTEYDRFRYVVAYKTEYDRFRYVVAS